MVCSWDLCLLWLNMLESPAVWLQGYFSVFVSNLKLLPCWKFILLHLTYPEVNYIIPWQKRMKAALKSRLVPNTTWANRFFCIPSTLTRAFFHVIFVVTALFLSEIMILVFPLYMLVAVYMQETKSPSGAKDDLQTQLISSNRFSNLYYYYSQVQDSSRGCLDNLRAKLVSSV